MALSCALAEASGKALTCRSHLRKWSVLTAADCTSKLQWWRRRRADEAGFRGKASGGSRRSRSFVARRVRTDAHTASQRTRTHTRSAAARPHAAQRARSRSRGAEAGRWRDARGFAFPTLFPNSTGGYNPKARTRRGKKVTLVMFGAYLTFQQPYHFSYACSQRVVQEWLLHVCNQAENYRLQYYYDRGDLRVVQPAQARRGHTGSKASFIPDGIAGGVCLRSPQTALQRDPCETPVMSGTCVQGRGTTAESSTTR